MLTTVTDSNGLVAALATAHSGDTIQLAAGDYSPLLLRNLAFSGAGVTITSADPAHEAILNGLTVKNDTGLTFTNLELYVNPTAGTTAPYQVLSSTNIKLDHLNIHGSMDGNPQNDAAAMLIRDSHGVTVSNSELQQLGWGIAHINDDGLTIVGNNFHDIRVDGVRGGGSSNVLVAHNSFTNFDPMAGDHGDAIQFWTTGTTVAAHDITVSDNVAMRGSGGLFQGVFFRDELGNLPFSNVSITGNLVVGGMYNGIEVGGSHNVNIANNTVVGLADQSSWIQTFSDTGVTMSHNVSTQYLSTNNTGVTETSDTTIATPTDGGAAALATWVASHTTSPMDALSASHLASAANQAVASILATKLAVVTVNGTAGADHLGVDNAHDTIINAGDGNDLLYGGGIGNNTLIGGNGDDTYFVKSQFDTIVELPGGGNDTVYSSGDYALPANVENLRLTGTGNIGAGNDMDNKISGSSGDDQLYGMGGNDVIQAGDGNDFASGGDGNDTISGGNGDDTVVGDAGNDYLNGDAGNDSLSGGTGNDTLEGGDGSDTMSGGPGADLFIFRQSDVTLASTDRITDFSTADGDKISLAAIDAKAGTTANDAFTFIGTQAFHHIAGELHYTVVGSDSIVSGDTNGDGIADFSIVLSNVTTLHATDFIL